MCNLTPDQIVRVSNGAISLEEAERLKEAWNTKEGREALIELNEAIEKLKKHVLGEDYDNKR
jgi:hypothetical protein